MGELARCQKDGEVEKCSRTSAKTSNSKAYTQASRRLVRELPPATKASPLSKESHVS